MKERKRCLWLIGCLVFLVGCIPQVDFTAQPQKGNAPLTVQFQDQSVSSCPIIAWRWDFGDGQTSDQQHPEHIYQDPGQYTVQLIAQTEFGADGLTKKDYITVLKPDLPIANFQASPTKGKVPLKVNFSNLTGPHKENYTWAWKFGDGTTSDEENPAHLYQQVGVYDVKLTAISPEGTDTKTAEYLIVVQSPHQIPGIYYGPFINTNPGSEVTYQQITKHLKSLAPYTEYVSFYTLPNTAEIAVQLQLKPILMVWLNENLANNEMAITAAIETGKKGLVCKIIVGDRCLEHQTLTEGQLVDYLNRIKQAVQVPVGYSDAWQFILQAKQVWPVVDFVGLDYTPYWDQEVADPLADLQDKYQQLKQAVGDKEVIITDTGWPLTDDPETACQYFRDCLDWVEQENVTIIYFEAYDESSWRGQNWSIFNLDGTPKECIKNALTEE